MSDQDGDKEIYRLRADGSDAQQFTHNSSEDIFSGLSAPIDLPFGGGLLLFVGGMLIVLPFGVAAVFRRSVSKGEHLSSC